MAWRVAHSLNVLLDQLNRMAPGRDTSADGSIGDASHSSRVSDHNPDPLGIVRARDFTHDPAGGLDCGWLAAVLVAKQDSRLKYVIWNGMIYSRRDAIWAWRRYTGSNRHEHHLHLSVVADARADGTAPWDLNIRPPEEETDVANVELVHGDSMQPVPGRNYVYGDFVFMVEYSPVYPGGAGRRYMANTPTFRRAVQVLGPPSQMRQADLDAIHVIPGGEIPKEAGPQ